MAKLYLFLGYSGLLPFLLFALLNTFYSDTTSIFLNLFLTYSACILSFLSGSLWGQTLLLTRTIPWVLIFSNLMTVIAWIAIVINIPKLSLLVLLIGFIASLVSDRKLNSEAPLAHPEDYLTMRMNLTAVVVVTHLIMLL